MPDFGQCRLLLLLGGVCTPTVSTGTGAHENDEMIWTDHYNDPDVAQFYDIENGWAEDFDFCSDLAKGRRAILDLGCGTGMLAAALTRRTDCLVADVDPAAAMLALAKQRRGGASVCWVLDDARTVRLNRRFDLVPNNRAVGQLVIRSGVPEGKSEFSYLSQFRLLEPPSKRRNLWVSLVRREDNPFAIAIRRGRST
jgi:SAM-dependent methyltransferase